HVSHSRQGVAPITATSDVRKQEGHFGMASRERDELRSIRRLLPRPIAPAMLPDVVQHRHATLTRQLADWIEQLVVSPPASRELDADHAGIETAPDFPERMGGVVRIDCDVSADLALVLARQSQQRSVAVLE